MNLVQIQERLKDAPIQSIMQYANGMNPMVPPYLALAELKRRESINQGAQAQQAMRQGQPPSVKEQIEQTAGLAALQQQMQQQGLQNLASQAAPAGIPEGVPQPRRQPESEGLASVPVRKDMFNFSDGGIVAFQSGGFAEEMSGALEPTERETRRKPTEDEVQRVVEELRRQGKTVGLSTVRDIREGRFPIPQPTAPAVIPAPVAQRTPAARAEQPPGLPMAERRTGALPPPGPSAGGIGLPSIRTGAMPQTPPDMDIRVASRAGLPPVAGSDEASKMMLEAMRSKMTPEQAYEAQRKLEGLYGLTAPYGEERMKRAQAMEAARQQELEDRGLERLMRVMGGIGSRGLQGASPAYLQSLESERAADAAFRKQMDELMGGVEAQRRAEAMAGMSGAQKRMDEERQRGLGAAEKVFDAETRRKNEEFRIRLENQLRSMQPNEASILMNVMADLRRRYPDKSEAEIYAMAREAQQGATPELKRQQDYAKQYDIAAKNWADPTVLKEKGLTREQYIERHIREALQLPKRELDIGNIPPIPAGAVRLKGGQ